MKERIETEQEPNCQICKKYKGTHTMNGVPVCIWCVLS